MTKSWMARAEAIIDRSGKKADVVRAILMYEGVRQAALCREGYSESSAFYQVKGEKATAREVFIGRALDLFDYRARITQGEGAIDTYVYQYALDANPQAVLEHSENWARTRDALAAANP